MSVIICQEIYKFDNQLNNNLWLRYWIKLRKTYLYLLVEENNDYDENNDFYENND